MGGSQPGEGGLAHLQAIYVSPKLFLHVACLSIVCHYYKMERLLGELNQRKQHKGKVDFLF
jgi:hypothetical protein